jgi:hypothetical protein
VEKAISIDASDLQFQLHKCAVCKALGDIPAAISAGEIALTLASPNVPQLVRLADLHARHGGVAHWRRSFKLACMVLGKLIGRRNL